MKHTRYSNMQPNRAITIISLLVFLFPVLPANQNAEESSLIPVFFRVFCQDQPAGNLSSENFTVIIDDVRVSRPRIVPASAVTMRAGGGSEAAESLILIFHVFNPSDKQWRQMSAMIRQLISATDHLRILLPSQTLLVDRVASVDGTMQMINEMLNEENPLTAASRSAIENMNRYLDDVRRESYRIVDRDGPIDDGEYTGVHLHYYMKGLKSSLQNYLVMKRDFRKRFVLPQLERIKRTIQMPATGEYLQTACLFYQAPPLPQLSKQNRRMIRHWIRQLSDSDWNDEIDYAGQIYELLGEIDAVFTSNFNGYGNQFERLWIDGGVKLFSVFIGLTENGGPTGEKGPAWNRNLNHVFSAASLHSGGGTIALKDAEMKVSWRESIPDTGYVLWVDPSTLAGGVPLTIRTDRSRCRVYHPAVIQPPVTEPTLPAPGISELRVARQTLSFQVELDSGKVREIRPVRLQIRIMDSAGHTIFDQAKTLVPKRKIITIEIGLPALEPGRYFFSIITGYPDSEVTTLTMIEKDFVH